ncbi:hypothetical protein [Rhizobium terrae]|uniref:hypothetical protein n=1 Tax=Rhizobium terrae TaxID=2171756 RepID=UPI000E3E8395|nr:hypothetical protein [Rhizobium terrae]
MTKSNIDFAQFALAPRRPQGEATPVVEDAPSISSDAPEIVPVPQNRDDQSAPLLQRLSDGERHQRRATRAAEQEETRRKLKNLKRAKERNIRFYVNVPLEQDVKNRLMRAAHENDVHMTIIMQAAIDTYLKDNGY